LRVADNVERAFAYVVHVPVEGHDKAGPTVGSVELVEERRSGRVADQVRQQSRLRLRTGGPNVANRSDERNQSDDHQCSESTMASLANQGTADAGHDIVLDDQ
jgi:hypothetical protein